LKEGIEVYIRKIIPKNAQLTQHQHAKSKQFPNQSGILPKLAKIAENKEKTTKMNMMHNNKTKFPCP
jgi:hypothetical protein